VGWDDLGRYHEWWRSERAVPFAPWTSRGLDPVTVPMPARRGLAILQARLEDPAGRVLQRNFTSFAVEDGPSPREETLREGDRTLRILRASPSSPSRESWSEKAWGAMSGGKRNGAGAGFFEYRLPWPRDVRADEVLGAAFVAELGAKELLGKDRPDRGRVEGDFMRGSGTHDPSLNPNAYPMTDVRKHPSAVRLAVGSFPVGLVDLPDDPADHRGLLSWHAQARDGRLDEAGSYGYLVSATIPEGAVREAAASGELVVRLEVDPSLPGGLAVYGERTGRYPLDPTVVLTLRP
jgi:hypothetical protein